VPDDRCDLLCLDLPKAEAVRAMCPSEQQARALAAGFRALGDPTRLTIALALRATDELCVCDLAWIAERAETSSPTTFAPCAPPALPTIAATGRWPSTR
jgi:ArsR family transcriptional regulator, lead/cadmium/zinc/bismuth-responsive transcriptional repressor